MDSSCQQINVLVAVLVLANFVMFGLQMMHLSHHSDDSSHKFNTLSRDNTHTHQYTSLLRAKFDALHSALHWSETVGDVEAQVTKQDADAMDSTSLLELPRFKEPTMMNISIVMDWITDADYFSYMNYKSLESLLMQYPNAKVVVNLIGPKAVESYKVGNLMSKYYFQKYEKMGYDVQIRPLFSFYSPRNREYVAQYKPLGHAYWDKTYRSCCYGQLTTIELKTKRFTIPLHLFFYRRILHLYEHGGLYSDFTWYHRQPLDMFIDRINDRTGSDVGDTGNREYHGAVLTEVCRATKAHDHLVAFPQLQKMKKFERQTEQKVCFSSALLAFSKGSSVLRCMLGQYDDDASDLQQCIGKSDTENMYSSTRCIKEAFARCFQTSGHRNELLYFEHIDDLASIAKVTTSSDIGDTISSKAAVLAEAVRTAANASLSDRVAYTLQSSSNAAHHPRSATSALIYCEQWWRVLRQQDQESRANPMFAVNKVVKWKHAVNMADICASEKQSNSETEYFHEWHRESVSKLVQQPATLESLVHSDVLWMGSLAAFTTDWLVSHESSIFGQLLRNHRLLSKSPLHNMDTLQYALTPERNRITARNLILPTSTEIGASSSGSERVVSVLQPTCHHFNISDDAPAALKRQAHSRCAPLFIIAGYMKAGTTAMFGAIMTHPQMLYNLRGVSFKETGCYLVSYDRNRRMQCFPYVEEHQHLYCGDGTVWYANMYLSSQRMLQDNPNMKIIFIIRDSVQRTASHHLFIFSYLKDHGLADLNEAIGIALNGSLMILYEYALDAVKEVDESLKTQKIKQMVNYFYDNIFEPEANSSDTWSEAKELVVYSLYFPSIYKWHQLVSNPASILVLRSEDYDPDRIETPAKLSYLQRVLQDSPQEWEELQTQYSQLQRKVRRMNNSMGSDDEEQYEAEDFLDKQYLLERMNTLYRFLGVSPVSSIGSYNKHVTGRKRVQNQFSMSRETEQRLRSFFMPFDILLDDFLKIHCATCNYSF